jgi:hypothetical protein
VYIASRRYRTKSFSFYWNLSIVMRLSSCGLCVIEVSRWLHWKVEPFLLVLKNLLEQSFTPTNGAMWCLRTPFQCNYKSPITFPPQTISVHQRVISISTKPVCASYFAARRFVCRTLLDEHTSAALQPGIKPSPLNLL